jgi:phospholipase/carboxylesterase
MKFSQFLSRVNRSMPFTIARQSSPNKLATLVLLHGLGADEHDLIGLAPYLDDRLEVLSLRAPRNCQFGGYSWFDASIAEGLFNIDCDHARESLANLCAFLEEFEEPPFLAGFSQGAMMAIGVCLERPDLVSAAVCMSGALLPCFKADSSRLPPMLLTHGQFDPVVSFSYGLSAAGTLRETGADVTFERFPMSHEINEDCLALVSRWLSEKINMQIAK